MVRTFVVSRTFRSCTTCQWVSSVSVNAVAPRVVVVVGLANGIASTLGVSARVNAVLVYAGLSSRAI